MKRKTYRGKTMKQARMKVKRDLGTDAKILETRKVREGGMFGFFSETYVEVDACKPPRRNRSTTKATGTRTRSTTAPRTSRSERNGSANGSSSDSFERSVNEPVEPKISPREQATQLIKERENGGANANHTYNRPAPKNAPSATNGSAAATSNGNENGDGPSITEEQIRKVVDNTDRLSEKLDKIAEDLEGSDEQSSAQSGENYPGELSVLFDQLLEAGVQREYARDLVGRAERSLQTDEVDRRDPVEDTVKDLVEEDLSVADPLRTDRDETLLIPFVGPTGVGKTTTMAKLAAHFSVEERQSVSFITFDTYRLAAVEQLRCYADILQVPIEAVMSEEEFEETVEDFETESDIIFIDTAGRSQYDHDKITELEGMLDETREIITHLVIDATSRTEDLDSIFEGFKSIGYDRLVVTKLDETRRHGTIYNLSRRSDKPIAYFTDGQDVPDDLRMMEPDELSELLLSDENTLTSIGHSDQ